MAGKCGTCGGGTPKVETQVVIRADGSSFEVSSPLEAKVKVLQGEGKSYHAKAA